MASDETSLTLSRPAGQAGSSLALSMRWSGSGGTWSKLYGDGDLDYNLFGQGSGTFEVRSGGIIWLWERPRPQLVDPGDPVNQDVRQVQDDVRVILWDAPQFYAQVPQTPETSASVDGDGVTTVTIPPVATMSGSARLHNPKNADLKNQVIDWKMQRT